MTVKNHLKKEKKYFNHFEFAVSPIAIQFKREQADFKRLDNQSCIATNTLASTVGKPHALKCIETCAYDSPGVATAPQSQRFNI